MARTQFTNQAVTIASGGTKSDPIDARGYNLFGMIKPATTGDAISFEVATSREGTYTALLTTGTTAASVTTAAAAGTYPIPESLGLERFPWFKLVSDASEAADRTITVTKARY